MLSTVDEIRSISRSNTLEDELEQQFIQQRLDDIVCPILSLPPEVTSEIFIWCLPGSSEDHLGPTLKRPLRAPILLLHICRIWRFIAISTPPLWTNLHLKLPSLPGRFLESGTYQKFLSDWLARSGACPLTLNLGGLDAEPDRLLIPTALNHFASHTQILNLNVKPGYYKDHTPDFSILQKLTLSFSGVVDEAEINDGNPIQTFIAAPQLRDISLVNAPPSLLAIRWEQLTVFGGEMLSSTECIALLRSAPSLVECTFYSPYLAPNTPSISHVGLKSLTNVEDGDVLFPFLTLPTLQTLDIAVFHPSEAVLPFISRSTASLLKFSGPGSPELPLNSFFSMRVLTHLQLEPLESQYVVELLGLLNRAENPTFLPQLRALDLFSCSPYDYEVLVPALSSRRTRTRDGGARLRSFHQSWETGFQASPQGDTDIALKELIEGGMEIELGPWL
ncbi:hypothetical protein C8F04DRAFT_1395588 [Mycena alexandri]|uniref:F-box domain-containing protein n=1 Tax=Mycena alexandri TaxID=1745969 RepID=A0AAD6SYK7_9AGAR|nr:hypothetical protein C8F04DRAFT_1395588 [Mycena alexandri]